MTTIPFGPWTLTLDDDRTHCWMEWTQPIGDRTMQELTKPIDAFDRAAMALSEIKIRLK